MSSEEMKDNIEKKNNLSRNTMNYIVKWIY